MNQITVDNKMFVVIHEIRSLDHSIHSAYDQRTSYKRKSRMGDRLILNDT
jgi:hypothetical protein